MDTNNDIEKILSEDPIMDDKSINKKFKMFRNFKKPDLKNILTRKRLIIGGLVILILLGFLLLSNLGGCDECEVCKECNNCIQNISIIDIRDQIINKGYVELNDGELILAPYLG